MFIINKTWVLLTAAPSQFGCDCDEISIFRPILNTNWY